MEFFDRGICPGDAGRALKLPDKGMKWAVHVKGRSEVLQTGDGGITEVFTERQRQTRLAESSGCRQKNDLAVAFLCVVPTMPQQSNLLGPADQGGQTLRSPAIEASASPAFAGDAPYPSGAGNSFEFVRPEVLILEGDTGKAMGQFANQHGIGRCRRLNSCRQIQRLADRNP